MSGAPFISVVIPTFNRKDALVACLSRLDAQSYPRAGFEVVVVDDGSTDGTEGEVERFATDSGLPLSCHRQDHAGPAAARNAGAGRARGEVLAFTEDDVEPDRRWLERAANYFRDPATDAVE